MNQPVLRWKYSRTVRYTYPTLYVTGQILKKGRKGKLARLITTPLGKIIIHTTPNYVKGEAYTLYVGKSSLYNAVNSCSSNLSVSLNSEKASVIDLSFKDNSTQRAEDVLSMLISFITRIG